MERQFDVIIERDEEGYYVASVPQLAGAATRRRDHWTMSWIEFVRRSHFV